MVKNNLNAIIKMIKKKENKSDSMKVEAYNTNAFSKMKNKKGKKQVSLKTEVNNTRLIILTTNIMENSLNFMKME